MAKLSKETKQRLQQVFQCGQFVIRWGFIPTVLYLGFKRGADPGMPEPTVLRYSSLAFWGTLSRILFWAGPILLADVLGN
uniref:Mitochondrial import receptor subunit TOM7 homolog n=1 Tax=Pygocentrus nattereri TaxID=42514 RepID=A0AAR2IJM6_PYGNA